MTYSTAICAEVICIRLMATDLLYKVTHTPLYKLGDIYQVTCTKVHIRKKIHYKIHIRSNIKTSVLLILF